MNKNPHKKANNNNNTNNRNHNINPQAPQPLTLKTVSMRNLASMLQQITKNKLAGIKNNHYTNFIPAMGYIFYDHEYAHFDATHEVMRIGSAGFIVTDCAGNVLKRYFSYIDPAASPKFKTKNIGHNPSFAQFWVDSGLQTLIAHNVFVSHGAPNSDLSFIARELANANITLPAVEFVDTSLIDGDDHQVSLAKMCKRYNIKLDHHHDAYYDAETCMKVFFASAKKHGAPHDTFIWVNNKYEDAREKNSLKRTFRKATRTPKNTSTTTHTKMQSDNKTKAKNALASKTTPATTGSPNNKLTNKCSQNMPAQYSLAQCSPAQTNAIQKTPTTKAASSTKPEKTIQLKGLKPYVSGSFTKDTLTEKMFKQALQLHKTAGRAETYGSSDFIVLGKDYSKNTVKKARNTKRPIVRLEDFVKITKDPNAIDVPVL